MSTDATTLLRQLASGVRPTPVTGSGQPTAAAALAEGQFADLLRRAQSGELASSRPVTLGPDADVALSDDQLARIALAADKAEAAGMRTALVLIDRQPVILDVPSRTITGAADVGPGTGELVGDIDGLINLSPDLLAAPEGPAILPLPSSAGAGASLAALLEARERNTAA